MNNNTLNRFIPPVTLNIIIVTIIIWIAQIIIPSLTNKLGLHFFLSDNFNPIQMFSYIFLHSTDSFNHIFFNMFALWMFGSIIENFWGSKRYLLFYITCGLSAALTQELVWWFSMPQEILLNYQNTLASLNTIGASGAIFGLLLAYGMLFPNSYLYVYFFIPIKAKYFVIIYGLLELFLGVTQTMSGVAHFAHLGGMIGGIILIFIWRNHRYIDGHYK